MPQTNQAITNVICEVKKIPAYALLLDCFVQFMSYSSSFLTIQNCTPLFILIFHGCSLIPVYAQH